MEPILFVDNLLIIDGNKKTSKILKKSVDKCGCKCYYIQALSLRGQEMNPKREKAPDFEN